jgi:acyl-CoA dehydrogenase
MALDQETLDQLLNTVDKFVQQRLRPLESQVGEEDKIPLDVIQEMKDLGFYGLTIPEEYGGLGLPLGLHLALMLALDLNLLLLTVQKPKNKNTCQRWQQEK